MKTQGTTIEDKDLGIDERLDSYESFFDHEWARQLFELVDQTRLYPLVFDLCTDWKGAANTGRLPWLMIQSLEGFHNGYSQSNEPLWQRVTKALRNHLLERTKHSFSFTKQKELVGIIDKLSKQAQEDISKAPLPFDKHDVWNSFLKSSEFSISLWSSQRLCYGAVYYGYENFLRQCVSVGKRPVAQKHTSMRVLKSDLSNLFGAKIGEACLGDDKIIFAGQVRNALVHNGGRATSEIQANAGILTIVDGRIDIKPQDVRELYNLLKVHVTALAEAGIMLPQFGV